MFKWLKNLFKKEKYGETFIYRCPRCYSTNLGYITSLSNYIEVFWYGKKPKYESKFICHTCNLLDSQNKLIKEKIYNGN